MDAAVGERFDSCHRGSHVGGQGQLNGGSACGGLGT
jgi:hypothetical protein